jgi:hypothetical protein
MPVSHARVPSRAPDAVAGQERVPDLLEVLAQVAGPRKRRGRRFAIPAPAISAQSHKGPACSTRQER